MEFRRWATDVLRRYIVDDGMLVAIIIMIAESKPEEKEAMVALVMNLLMQRGRCQV